MSRSARFAIFSLLRARRVLRLAAGLGCLLLAGCSTPTATKPPADEAESQSIDPVAQARSEFQKLVERLLEIEPALTRLLDEITARLDKPAQIRVEQELLSFFTGERFAAALRNESFLSGATLLQQFSVESAAALKTHGLDRPLLALVDDLAGLAVAIADIAAVSDDGRALQNVFTLVHRDVLPALVEIRALVTEELLDANEAATLTLKVEEQLQSINQQLASLRSRAQAVSTPTPPSL